MSFVVADREVVRWAWRGQLARDVDRVLPRDNGTPSDQFFGAGFNLNACLSYHASRWMLTAGAIDVGNTYRDPYDSLSRTYGILARPGFSAFGLNDPYYYDTVDDHW